MWVNRVQDIEEEGSPVRRAVTVGQISALPHGGGGRGASSQSIREISCFEFFGKGVQRTKCA